MTQCWNDAGPQSATLAQHQTSTGSTPRVYWVERSPVNTKHLYNIYTMLEQHRRRIADVVQKLYKCFVFPGNNSWSGITYCLRRLQAHIDPMSVKCWASVAGVGQYQFNPIQYYMLQVLACWRYGHDALK